MHNQICLILEHRVSLCDTQLQYLHRPFLHKIRLVSVQICASEVC